MRSIKQFIKNFNFERPDFENVPVGFPWISKRGLTREEGHLLDAIVTAWILEEVGYFFKYFPGFRLIKLSFNLAFYIVFLLTLVSFTYYLNIEYHLGLNFLTEIFA